VIEQIKLLREVSSRDWANAVGPDSWDDYQFWFRMNTEHIEHTRYYKVKIDIPTNGKFETTIPKTMHLTLNEIVSVPNFKPEVKFKYLGIEKEVYAPEEFFLEVVNMGNKVCGPLNSIEITTTQKITILGYAAISNVRKL